MERVSRDKLTYIEDTKGAFEYLAANLTPSLLAHDDYLVFLLRQFAHYRLSTDLLSATLLKSKTPEKNKTLLLALAEHLPP